MTDLNKDELVTVEDTRYEDTYYNEYYDSEESETVGNLVTEATGTLRDLVLAKVGKYVGEVYITEEHWNSGYCDTCSCPETDFKIEVDGKVVFDTRNTGWRYRYELGTEFTTFAVLQKWLTEETKEDS